ncbi:hypothetical protein DPEC_G00209220 [Dallia pectoralis]|uniref:Uncharacterized protein n=1 Tax=Dallia pectoralis TaxID=75939 RepID=A0ACC2G5H0_DALPE|nr:hypothetical protein DPEC_G00209220 [Dallia pectoralis]
MSRCSNHSRMSFSMDSADSTSTQTSLDKAVDEDKRSGEGRITNFKLLKKTNKVAPFVTTGPVAADETKKRSLLKEIRAGLARVFCFSCVKRSRN